MLPKARGTGRRLDWRGSIVILCQFQFSLVEVDHHTIPVIAARQPKKRSGFS